MLSRWEPAFQYCLEEVGSAVFPPLQNNYTLNCTVSNWTQLIPTSCNCFNLLKVVLTQALLYCVAKSKAWVDIWLFLLVATHWITPPPKPPWTCLFFPLPDSRPPPEPPPFFCRHEVEPFREGGVTSRPSVTCSTALPRIHLS